MGVTDYGTQTISFNYNEPGRSEVFNKLNYKLVQKGIYEGGFLSYVDATTVQLSPLVSFIEDNTTEIGVRLETELAVDITVSTAAPYIILRFNWVNLSNNYADVLAVAYGDILPNDIIIGRCAYDDSNVLQSTFDYTRRNISSLQNLDNKQSNLIVTSTEAPSNTVEVSAGEVLVLNSPFSFAGATSSIISDTVDGRIDIVYIDDFGDLQILEGTDAASPVVPDFPSRGHALSKITRGALETVIRGDQIEQFDFDGVSGGASTSGAAGSSIEATTGESIDAGELVYFSSDGKLYLADNRSFEKSIVAGFALETAGVDTLITVGKLGLVQEYSGLTIGTEYYLGYNGLMITLGALNYSEYKVHIGTAQADDTIDAFIQIPEPTRNYDDGLAIGEMTEWGGNEDLSDIPDGYLALDGSEISRANYSELDNLFSAASYPWGNGDGSTTFNLPKGEFNSGWSSTSTWTAGASITINHNLGVPFDEYTGQIFVRDPAVPDKIYNVTDIETYVSNIYGQRLNGINGDLNNCYLQIGDAVGRYLADSGISYTVISTWEYKVVLTKINKVATYADMGFRKVFNITTSTDATFALPDASTQLTEFFIKRKGAGSGVVNFTTVSSQTINDNPASSWGLKGESDITLLPIGGNWEVKDMNGFRFHVQDQKASGTAAGDFTSGAWRTRVLNTEETSSLEGASLSSNQITLLAGIYKIKALAPAFSVNGNKCRIYDITNTSDLLIGMTIHSDNTSGVGGVANVIGTITLTGTTVIELQHRCITSKTSNGLGVSVNFSVVEVFADIEIEKIG